ncbi:30S ribosomal protein S9 [Hirschfeldia incana]|nr:30S ribosomal protein S9 [Hirschfeldia incana]
MMLSRLFLRSSNLRLATLVSSKSNSQIFSSSFIRPLSTNSSGGGGGGENGGNRNDTPWSLSGANDGGKSDPFSSNDSWAGGEGKWAKEEPKRWNMKEEGDEKAVFGNNEGGEVANTGFGDVKPSGWDAVYSIKPWELKEEGDDDKVVFDTTSGGDMMPVGFDNSSLVNEEEERAKKEVFEKEEKELTEVIKGPDRAFGDLIAKSGITDEMLDSLIALKDFQGVQGLPPLTEIENLRREKSSKKSSRAEIELQMQEDIAKSRVRQVDESGRAYGTGRRKCSIARVWIVPGKGKFLVNDKEFDVYFPMLDHRAALLRPLAETKTLGNWDISCTVTGGGTTGQVGAIQLGISRALQNWEPDMRTALRAAGFLTRDSRVVERKKPGKAKARKSFQWVKR